MGWALISCSTCYAQTTISDLTSVDWSKSTARDSIGFSELLDACIHGQDQLRRDISKDPNNFPLQELEDPEKFETDEHRQWEYQMKRMPVNIVGVKDLSENVIVEIQFDTAEVVFCKSRIVHALLTIRNESKYILPSYSIDFDPIPGLSLKSSETTVVSGQNVKVQHLSKRELRYHISRFDTDSEIQIKLSMTVDCDGRGSSIALAEQREIVVEPSYTLEFIGYLLNYKEKQLYKAVTKNTTETHLTLTSNYAH